MRLKIELFANWAQQQNPDGPATFCRQGSTNAFQVSWAEYRGGRPPNAGTNEMKLLAAGFGPKQGFGEMLESSTGACSFGCFGTAVFASTEYPRVQVWFITNGSDHIMATHICDQEPGPEEVSEVQRIAESLALGPDQPPKPK
jgi:hypothetical protein